MRIPVLLQLTALIVAAHTATDASTGTRDPLRWPFASTSIWNMPIGGDAVYVPAKLPPQKQVQPEEDILILETSGPRINVVFNGTTWRGPSRYPGTVNTNRILVHDARIPKDFVVLDKNMKYACAILMDDGVTVKQNQPFSRFPGADFATSAYVYPDDNLVTGDGIKGAHGGSGMSSIGGTIRLGELLPGAPPIRHALKVTISAQHLYYDADTKGYRWPAWKADGYAARNYKGTLKPLRMGSLLALPPDTDIRSLGLKLEASVKIATALRDYGAYIVDDPVTSAYGIAVERSPRGRVIDEFEKAYGQPFWASTGPWAEDIRNIFACVSVVDNNSPSSIGGGGKPRQPLAPPFDDQLAKVGQLRAIDDFQASKTQGYVPCYQDSARQALAIDAAAHKDKFAAVSAVFGGTAGVYDVVLTALTETDGESSYELAVNGKKLGTRQNPATEEDYAPAQHRWKGIELKPRDEITVAFNTHSNGRTPEGAGFAYSRGRWTSVAFVAPGATYKTDQEQAKQAEEPLFPDKDTSTWFQFNFDPAAAQKVYQEKDGLLVVEAEHYASQTHSELRKWHLTTRDQTPTVASDGDPNHAETASGGAYMEILPDTRRNHSEPLIPNENFSEDPGRLAVLYYPVYISTPGRYYVWARTCPTGSEDNGLHVGLDGKWPGSGTRMQWLSKNKAWHWDSKQRTEKVHTGVNYRVYLDIKEPGYHTILFSMREDGLEMDKWLITTEKDFLKHGDTGLGPAESSRR